MRVLLVEDDLQISRRLSARLSASGFLVEAAPAAEAALTWPKPEQLAAMMVDLGLPGRAGSI